MLINKQNLCYIGGDITLEKKYNHFVPQFYMRNFSNDNKSIGMYLIKDKKKILVTSIAKIGGRDYLYGKDSEIENLFCKYENEWSKIIKKIINTETLYGLNSDEYTLLVSFILLSDLRSSVTANSFEDLINSTANLSLKIQGDTNNEDLHKKIMNINIPNLAALQSFPKLLKLTSDLKLCLIVNKSNKQFITSDNIVNKYNLFFMEKNYIRNYGYGQVGFQCFVPISPYLCLCLYDSICYDVKFDLQERLIINGSDIIVNINKLILSNSRDIILFNNKERDWVINRLVINKKDSLIDEADILKSQDGEYIICTGVKSSHIKIKLTIFKIKSSFLSIPMPLNAAGLIRPIYDNVFPKEKDNDVLKKLEGKKFTYFKN